MEHKIQIECIAPSQIPFWERRHLRKKLRTAFMRWELHDAEVSGEPRWMAEMAASVLPGGQAVAEPSSAVDYLVALWDGVPGPESPIAQKVREFLENHEAERVIYIPLNENRKLDATAGPSGGEEYQYDVFLSAGQADAGMAARIRRRLKAIRAPRSVARKTGSRRVEEVYVSTGDEMTEEDRSALAASGILVLICSPASEQGGKNREVTELFCRLRGRRHIQTALVAGEPAAAFPPRLLTAETFSDPKTGETVHMAGDPLAANFKRENKRQYHRETMRLLAPVFGCAFDDLFRRHVQQRRNLLFRIVSVVVIVTAAVTAGIFSLSLWEAGTALAMEISAERTAQQLIREEEATQMAKEITQEAETQNAEAIYAEAVKLTYDANQASADGNLLKALDNLYRATPEQDIKRERLPQGAEALMREIMGMGQIVPLLRIAEATNPVVVDQVLYCREVRSEAVISYNLENGEGPANVAESLPAAKNDGFTFPLADNCELIFAEDGQAYIRDADGQTIESHTAHASRPLDVFTIAAGRRLVSYSADEVVVWAMVPAGGRRLLAAHEGAINDLWMGEAMFATAGADGKAVLFDYEGERQLTMEVNYPLSTVEVRESANRAVTCGTDGQVALWELPAGTLLWETTVSGAGVARLSPAGKAVVAGPRIDSEMLAEPESLDAGKMGTLLSGDTGAVVSSFNCNGLPWYGEIFEGEKFVICECLEYSNVKIYLYDGRTGTVAELCSNGGYYAENAILSKFGGIAATNEYLTDHARTHDNYNNLKYSNGIGTKFLIPSPVEPDVILDVSTNDNVFFNMTGSSEISFNYDYVREHSYKHSRTVNCAAFSPDGTYAVTASEDGTATVMNKGGLAWLIYHQAPVIEAGISPGNSRVILADREGQVSLWPLGSFDDMRKTVGEVLRP